MGWTNKFNTNSWEIRKTTIGNRPKCVWFTTFNVLCLYIRGVKQLINGHYYSSL